MVQTSTCVLAPKGALNTSINTIQTNKTEPMFGYQQNIKEFIKRNKRCAVFVDMGLGKTRSTATAAAELYEEFEVHKILVIAPLRVCQSVWPQEIEKWNLGLRVSLVTGSYMSRRRAINKEADVYVINRENTAWLVDNYKDDWEWDMIIIDESTSFKNQGTRRFKALKKVAHKANRMVLLTGTPAPNGYLDLWSQIYLLDFGERLGKTFTKFKNMYFYPDYMGYNWTPRQHATKTINNKIKDLCLTLTAEDYLELPPVVYSEIPVTLSDKEKRMYDTMERDYILREANEQITAANAAALSNKLLQLANGAAYVQTDPTVKLVGRPYSIIHEHKLGALEDLIEANPGKSLLVAYSYKHDLERLKQRFPQAVELDKNPATIERWNKGKIDILLAHPASAGHGLNLQAGGSIAVWFGLTWSLEQYQQFNARLHRRGQNDGVVIHHIIARGTIDEVVMQTLSDKDKTQRALIAYLKEKQRGEQRV